MFYRWAGVYLIILPVNYVLEPEPSYFTMQCSLYNILRSYLMSALHTEESFSQNTILTNFITLLTSKLENCDTCLLIGKYIIDCFKICRSNCYLRHWTSAWWYEWKSMGGGVVVVGAAHGNLAGERDIPCISRGMYSNNGRQ